jgi:nitrogen-specific signal transduction histidine kinase
MKTRRTNNPRFLGALGFLGFLGALGSQNPEIIRWAKLSWLSLFSLLVFFPTMKVDGRWAHYRIHPRRKGLLFFLAGLGFLALLHTERPGLAMLAMLFSAPAQLAIDHKKELAISAKRLLGFGLPFLGLIVLLVVWVHPVFGLMISLLILPTLLAFSPVIEGKERFPLRELLPIFLLLFAAIILPAGGVFWFMNQAIKNEQMAVRQQLFELQRGQINTATKRMDEEISRLKSRLLVHREGSAPERFSLLVQEELGDGILVFCKDGKDFCYPKFGAVKKQAEASPEGEALKSRIIGLIRSKGWPEAKRLISDFAMDDLLRGACDTSGREILPALQLFYVQSNPGDVEVLDALQRRILDYSNPMPPVRRVFYMNALAGLGVEVEPWLGAEMVAMEVEDYPMLPTFVEKGGLTTLENSDLRMLSSQEVRAAILFRESTLIGHMQTVIDSSIAMKNVRIMLEKGNKSVPEPSVLVSGMWPTLGHDWKLNLYLDGKDPFTSHAKHRRKVQLGIGMSVVCVMSVICGLLVRSLLAQQRLTRMKNDFVATVTHELKTPLASTRMLVDTLLEGRVRDDTQQQEYLELIARENKRLSRLIDNFLTFSRMERNKRSFNFIEAEPAEIVETAVGTVHENYEQCGCELTVDIAKGLPLILADQDSMVQVLLNLLDNACKYSNGEKQIALSVYENGGAVCFAVKDNGIGMAKRELSKIMERFYQVDQSMTRKVGGAGLGLSIVSFIVDAHGGTIDTQSELGKGSVFTVNIPLNGGS